MFGLKDVVNFRREISGYVKGEFTLICIIGDARVSSLISTREANEAGRRGRSAACDVKLVASRVELRSRVGIRGMESNDLWALV